MAPYGKPLHPYITIYHDLVSNCMQMQNLTVRCSLIEQPWQNGSEWLQIWLALASVYYNVSTITIYSSLDLYADTKSQ